MIELSGDSQSGVPTPISKSAMNEETQKQEREYPDMNVRGARRPIMHPRVYRQVRAAMSRYRNQGKWKAWGLHRVRKQGIAILLRGPVGTGKTSIARWMGKEMGRRVKTLDVSTIASGEPGASEREVIKFFELCTEEECMVFMDECDSLLGNRTEISADGRTWQLSTMEQIMLQMNMFPWPIVCATNHADMLDPALADRFLFIIDVERPDEPRRVLLWKQKWPDEFPLKLKGKDAVMLSKYDLSGRQIENVICAVGSQCIADETMPTFEMFKEAAITEEGKHVEKSA